MNTEETTQQQIMSNLMANKQVTWQLLDQFMETLEEKINNGCHGVYSETLPLKFQTEGPDERDGLDIKSDKYHIYLEPQPSSVAGAGSLIVCYGKSVADNQPFSIQHHWIKTLHLSNQGDITLQVEQTLHEQDIAPDIICTPMDWVFNYEWARYLFTLTKARIKAKDAYDMYVENLLKPHPVARTL